MGAVDEPNLEFRPVGAAHGDRRFPRVGFYAVRPIQTGEELGYRRDPSATTQAKFSHRPCHCGAGSCRKWL